MKRPLGLFCAGSLLLAGLNAPVAQAAPRTLSVKDATVTEATATTARLVFVVKLSSAKSSEVFVDFATVEGKAEAPEDYRSKSGTLRFAPGRVRKKVEVVVKGDALDEPKEALSLRLSAPDGASIGDRSGEGVIFDDDGPPVMSITDRTVLEGNVLMQFIVTLDRPSGKTISASYGTVSSTATGGTSPGPGVDYLAPTDETVSFAPSEIEKTVTIEIFEDAIDESAETFSVVLSNASNVTFGDSSALGTILDDD